MRIAMGPATFDQWLVKKSSICFLQRLLAETAGSAFESRETLSQRSKYSVLAIEPKTDGSTEEPSRRVLVRKLQALSRKDGSKTALDMSMKSGVAILDKNTTGEKAHKALWLRANVAVRRAQGRLVVDRLEHRQNLKLWIELLDNRQRLYGFAGVADIWKSMRYREVYLPVVGTEADTIWPAFVNACIAHRLSPAQRDLLDEIYAHAKALYAQSGVVYDDLHKLLVGRNLRINAGHRALHWHRRFVKDFGAQHVDLKKLAADAFAAQNAKYVYKAFGQILADSPQRDLYDTFMAALLQSGDNASALRWHRRFVEQGDGPSPEMSANSRVQHLCYLDKDNSPPMVHDKSSAASADSALSPKPSFPALTRATMSTLVGEVHGIKPKEVSDTFVARMFATQAFSLAMVIRGLSIFGIDQLGPLALHEMVLRTSSRLEAKGWLDELQAMGIRVDQSVYGRLLRQISDEGPDELFGALFASDQHPEVFADHETQQQLLTFFLTTGDLSKAHLTLLALSLSGEIASREAWNQLLKHYARNADYEAMTLVLRQMKSVEMPVTATTVHAIRRFLLPWRNVARARSQTPLDLRQKKPLQTMTNVCIYAADHGTRVCGLWIELLKRYGKMHMWQELEHLVVWLAQRYGTSTRAYNTSRDRLIVDAVFSRHMLKAIVTWGFNDAAEKRLLHHDVPPKRSILRGHYETWAQGIVLLKRLYDQYGNHKIRIGRALVREALILRLWILYGPAFSNKPFNEQIRYQNRLSLAHYVQHANEAWGGQLFNISPDLLQNERTSHAELMVAVFGARRRVSKVRQECADVAAYGQFMQSAYGYRKTWIRNGRRRARAWHFSPFRIAPTTT